MGAWPKGRDCLTLAVLLGCIALLAGAQTALAAEGTGRISGTVTEAVSPFAGLGKIEVTVYEAGGSEFPVGFATTNASGQYTVEGLAGGSYKVEFAPEFESGLNFVTQYYNNKPPVEAEQVVVVEGETTKNIDAKLQEGGKIEGTATEAASPFGGLEKIEVTVYEAGGSELPVGFATTKAGGKYTVVGLAGGSYKVGFSPGFESGLNYVTQYYEGVSSLAGAKPVSVVQGATTEGIDAKLQVGGKVTGSATDASTHAALSGIYVFAVGAGEALAGLARTNASGRYTIVGLASGSYKIQFVDLGSGHYITEYYNNEPSFASADSVTVVQGSTTAGINAALVRKAPVNTAAPVASGIPAVGRMLSCSNGLWTGSPTPTYTYKWLRDGTVIAGATASVYIVQAADRGHGLACQVTATNKNGSAAAVSNVLRVPLAPLPLPLPAPVVGLLTSKIVVSHGWARVPITCANASCTGTITLTERVVVRHHRGRRTTFTRKTLILSKGSYALAAGHSATIRIRRRRRASTRWPERGTTACLPRSSRSLTRGRLDAEVGGPSQIVAKHGHRHRHR